MFPSFGDESGELVHWPLGMRGAALGLKLVGWTNLLRELFLILGFPDALFSLDRSLTCTVNLSMD